MSFSQEAKAEACRQPLGPPCCQLAELSAALHAGGSVVLEGGGRLGFHAVTESAAVARRLFMLLKSRAGVRPALAMSKSRTLGAARRYRLSASHDQGATRALIEMGILARSPGGGLRLREGIPHALVRRACCRRAYLRGALLTSGTVSAPKAGYRLEFVLAGEEYADAVIGLLEKFSMNPQRARRRDSFVVYLTDAESVAAVLSLVGSHAATMAFENVRILRGLRANANRAVNCETANIDKTVMAAQRQTAAFEKLLVSPKSADLPDDLRDMLALRLSNPEASFADLGDMLDPPLSKSGVMHRLKRLMDIAQTIG